MSYLGQAALKNTELKLFNVTSSRSATNTLSWTAANEQSLFITINGVKQQEDAYSIAGSPTVITLSSALVATDKMEVVGVLDIGVITTVGDAAISANKLGNNAVTTAKIADDAVTLAKQAAGTQGGTIYYGAAGAPTELAAGTSGKFLKTQGSGANPVWGSVSTDPTMGGDISGTASNATIVADAVTTTKILDNNVTLAKIADGTQGGVIYMGASGAPTELAAGTSGYFLKTLGILIEPSLF